MAVVAYMLDGMPSVYGKFIQAPKTGSIHDLAEAIDKALDIKCGNVLAQEYIYKELNYISVAKKIVQMLAGK